MHEDYKEHRVVYLAEPQFDAAEDEIDLCELWRIIWQGKWLILGITLLFTLSAAAVSFFYLPVLYKSDAVLEPAGSQGSGLGNLAGLVQNLPFSVGLPQGGKAEKIMAFLQSRTLKERLIRKYDLLPVLYKDLWDEKAKAWKTDNPKDAPTVTRAIQEKKLDDIYLANQDKKNNLITLSWISEDPQFAALMLKRVISELQYYLNHDYESDAKRDRIFVEQQLSKAEKELEYWDRQVPTGTLTLAKITRERFAAQTVYAELRKQLELAKIAEAKGLISFKVLDPPFTPEKKYKPKRALICILTMLTSGFIAVFLVFFLHYIKSVRASGVQDGSCG